MMMAEYRVFLFRYGGAQNIDLNKITDDARRQIEGLRSFSKFFNGFYQCIFEFSFSFLTIFKYSFPARPHTQV